MIYTITSTEIPQFDKAVTELYNKRIERRKEKLHYTASLDIAFNYAIKELCKDAEDKHVVFRSIANNGIEISINGKVERIFKSWQNVKFRFYCT